MLFNIFDRTPYTLRSGQIKHLCTDSDEVE